MTTEPSESQAPEGEDLSWPCGFVAVLVLAALYLIWRFAQLGIRFFEWVF